MRMTSERIAELRSIEGGVFEYRQDYEEQTYEDRSEEWQEMLDEIERLQAVVLGLVMKQVYVPAIIDEVTS